jgi:hypothetical protein
MKLRAPSALMLVLLMVGCGDDDPAGPSAETVAGTYILQTVNGVALPFVFVDQPGLRVEVISDQYVLNPDRTYTTTITFRETQDTTVTTSTDTYAGGWQVSGATVSLTSVEFGPETAAFTSGNTLTFSGAAQATRVYRK